MLARRYGDFDAAEDAVQEALLAASVHWPRDGIPAGARGWLIQTAERRLIDQWRSERVPRGQGDGRRPAGAARAGRCSDEDDTLTVLFMCCHPALTPASAIALTLRAVGGLTTAEIANAFMVDEATMAQRISRAKQRIKASGVPFRMPAGEEQEASRRSVLHVLYLIFNEGYTSSTGRALLRAELSDEAIRLTRMVRRAAARRRRGDRPARADAADRRAAARAHRRGRRADPAGRAGSDALGSGAHRRGARARRPGGEPGRGRRVPAPGRDRRRPRPRGNGGRHRLAADPRPLRAARPDDRQPDRHAQPGRRGGDGREPGGGPRACSTRSTSRSQGTTASTRSGRTCSSWPATRRRRRRTTGPRPSGRRACRSGASWRCRRRGSTPAPTDGR